MLRITQVESQDAPTIKLEGKLLCPWTEEVRSACQAAFTPGQPPRLDVSAVTYVDAEGTRLLAELIAAGVDVLGCSRFVATLLEREGQP